MKHVEVMAGWLEPEEKIGDLYFEVSRGMETSSFEYDPDWLGKQRISIDSELELFKGRQYPEDNRGFRIFSDSAPDRWGRTLIRRREIQQAKKEKRPKRTLNESDYLLGISDELRTGAVRFRDPDSQFALAHHEVPEVPAFEQLRELESSSLQYEKDPDNNLSWMSLLMAPGSSLGGARPKATVQMPSGELWIAKFPSRHDTYDSGAWEKTVYDLAELSGLKTVKSSLKIFSDCGATFLIQRFDRRLLPDKSSSHLHFVSSMTLLGMKDGDGADTGAGYTDLADFINTNGSRPREDLKELFRRIIFSMCISNTDDHFRNHGFLYESTGWCLSPVYDLNPNPDSTGFLALAVSCDDSQISVENFMQFASLISLSTDDVKQICLKIARTVKENWRMLARQNGISGREIQEMESAFLFCDEILACFDKVF